MNIKSFFRRISILPFFTSLLVLLLLESCAARKPWYDTQYSAWEGSAPPDSSQLVSSVFLVGDAGKVGPGDPVMTLLRNQLVEHNQPQNAVVFLGDNIYPAGLPEEGHELRERSEKRLIGQMDAVKGAPAWGIFIPGNHDWNDQGKGGLEGIKRQAAFVNNYMESDSSFYPQNGCPGPVVVHPHPDVAVILLDTEWWVHKFEKPVDKASGCTTWTKESFLQEIKNLVEQHADKHIVITQHHPFYTNGNHGGYFEVRDHFFPFRVLNHKLYIPFPVLGTIYVAVRKAGISPEDVNGGPYQALKNGIMKAVSGEKDVIISAGHEHILQYNRADNVHHILSGSGAKVSYGRTGKGAGFVHMQRGYARMNYYKDGSAWVEYWEPGEKLGEGVVVFRQHLYGGGNR